MNDLRVLDWQQILEKLEIYATSEAARSVLRKMAPLAAPGDAVTSFRAIAEAQTVLSYGERPFMESLDLFHAWYNRLKKKATLKTQELRDVRRFFVEVVTLREVLKPLRGNWVEEQMAQLMDAVPPLSAIDHLMTPSGEIRTDASENLHNLHREKQQQTRQLQQTLDRLVKQHDMEPVLQDRYVTSREGRWVLPVKGGMQHSFNGIIHDSSQSKQTVFMEPDEVVPLNNRLRQIEIEIEEEIERLLKAISNYLTTLLEPLQLTQAAMLSADARFAQAKLAESLQANACEFSEDRMELLDVRHPAMVFQNVRVVANTVKLDQQRRILLLSGPNAGGKTVLMKSVALAAHMARCGLPICAATGSRLPFFAELHVAVGDAQSVDAALSTFAAHLKVLNQATLAKGPKHLLLIDEICGSTDPEEGSALARSFIESYAEHRIFGVITSHFGALKIGWKPESGVVNGSLEYDTQSGQPTYQFLLGIPGQSLALHTARRVGVESTIVDRALEYLGPQAKIFQEHLREMESVKEEIHRLRGELHAETQDAKEHKRLYHDLLQKFRRERDQWMERVVKKTEKRIEELIEQANANSVFKKHERLQQIKNELPQIVKAPAAGSARKLETQEDFERAYPPGSTVFVPSLGQDAVVQGKANGKGEIPILSNSMRLFLHWQLLRPPQSVSNPTTQILRRTSGVAVTLQDTERVIDLRGQRVDDAIAQLEMQLDAAALANEDRVKIVHGHGTEALKRAVRSHLSRSVYVKKWQAAVPEVGGDGVTWAELKE